MLRVENIHVARGKLRVLEDVSFEVQEGEFVGVIGSNGAGKTSLLYSISGLLQPFSGSIVFLGESIVGLAPWQICDRGIIHIPEGRKLFPDMTVMENLEMGCYLPRPRKCKADSLKMVYLLFPVLEERRKQKAGTLSGGEQQMLAVGKGLMGTPKLLMLDEPTLGLAPRLGVEIFETLKFLKEQGVTSLVVSQEVLQVLRLADRVYVMENGRIVLQGSGEELLHNERVREAYLGL